MGEIVCPYAPKRVKMEFQNWLKIGIQNDMFGDGPEGDFAADAVADKSFRNFQKWDDLETYMVFRGACHEAVQAAKKCFRQWEVVREKRSR